MKNTNYLIKNYGMAFFAVIFMLLTASCGNGGRRGDYSRADDRNPCGITPELRKMLNKYSTANEGKCGLWLVTSKTTKYDDKGYPYHPFGCVDKEGKVVIPLEYNSGFEGPGVICVCNQDNKWGMLNLNGDEITPSVYDHIDLFYGDYTIVKQGDKFGIMNNKGALVVPVQYEKISRFYHECRNYGNTKYRFEDVFWLTNNGNSKVVNLTRTQGSINTEHIDTPYDYQVVKRDGKYAIVSYLGTETVPYQNIRWCSIGLSSAVDFSEGLVAVVKNNKIGFIDKKGNVKIPFQYEYSEFQFNFYNNFGVFSEGMAPMMKGGKWGYIDKSGNTAIPYVYDWASCFHKGSAMVMKGDLAGIIDKSNKVVLPFEFETGCFSGSAYSPGNVFVMCKNGKWGVYAPNGDCITPCQFDQQITFFAGYATVTKEGKQGLLDEHDHLLIPCEYETCMYDAWSKLVYVVKDGKWGILDLNNQVLVPAKYDQVGVYDIEKCDLFWVEKDGKRGLYDLCGNYILN